MANQIARTLLAPLLLGMFVFGLALPCLGQEADVPTKLQERDEEFKRPVVIVFEGPIDYQNTSYFKNRLSRAKRYGADLVVVEIDSPGGLAFQSLEMAELLRDVDWAYTVAFIPREAISGAALMSLGCDEIILGSQARFGDAGPIEFDPSLAAFRYVPAKAKSVLVRQARDLASAKERSKELAEALIDKNAAVFYRKKPGAAGGDIEFQTVYLSDDVPDPMDAAKKAKIDLNSWSLIEETGKERFFTVNGPRAVALDFADEIADDRAALAEELVVSGKIKEYRFKFSDSVVYWLNSPFVTGLLILMGLIALYFELSAPGIGAGGLIAALCAALFFWSRFAGGTAGWLEVILFVAGIVFLLMEVFVIPGFGVAGFAGLVLLFVSVVMASQDFVIPQTPTQLDSLVTTLLVISVATAAFLIGAVFISHKFGKIPILNRLSLAPPTEKIDTEIDKATGKAVPINHPQVSVGDWGVAESLLRPAGRVKFHGTSIDVVSDGTYLEPGVQVRVVEIAGNRIVVSEIEKNSGSA